MKTLKNIYIFAMQRIFISIAIQLQFLSKTYNKGVVSNSSRSNTVSVLCKTRRLRPLFINFFKLFSNAKNRKQFTIATTLQCNVSTTSRCVSITFRIFNRQWLSLVQNFNKTYTGFNEFYRCTQKLSLWHGQRLVRCLRQVAGTSKHVPSINTILFSDFSHTNNLLVWDFIFKN